MNQVQTYLLTPVYEEGSCRCIGVLQQLQTLLGNDATLTDVVRVVQRFQHEFGAQAQLEQVIQSLVGRFLEQQIAVRKGRSHGERSD